MFNDYFLFPHVGRMDDIWASYYVTSKKYKVVYANPTVYQKRNYHNFINDFKMEVIGYNNNLNLIEHLYKNPENILMTVTMKQIVSREKIMYFILPDISRARIKQLLPIL